ncbi:MAG TPA: hypothetical protein VK766_05335 [Cytophagaceae bacterium]|jgi:hypothetical protein|nr:hypothetical protein [Cytophagaceae bacterium]
MKKTAIGYFLLCTVLVSSCATIVGGAKYNAHVVVAGRPNAQIIYKGNVKGNGEAIFKVRRKEANKFQVTIKENGYDDQKINYVSRTFRGGAFVASILCWTGLVGGVPLPWGMTLDLITGAVWKPDLREKGISKENYKNYTYSITTDNHSIPYTNQSINHSNWQDNNNNTSLTDVLYLKNGDVISGVIIEKVPFKFVKIQTKGGNMFTYSAEEIDRITKE